MSYVEEYCPKEGSSETSHYVLLLTMGIKESQLRESTKCPEHSSLPSKLQCLTRSCSPGLENRGRRFLLYLMCPIVASGACPDVVPLLTTIGRNCGVFRKWGLQ